MENCPLPTPEKPPVFRGHSGFSSWIAGARQPGKAAIRDVSGKKPGEPLSRSSSSTDTRNAIDAHAVADMYQQRDKKQQA